MNDKSVVFSFPGLVTVILNIAIVIFLSFLFFLMIRALNKYLKVKSGENTSLQDVSTLSERIRSKRIEMNMTQEYVAEKIGVSRQAISKWESGKSSPSTSNLISIANLFNISVDDLIIGPVKHEK